MPIYSDHSQPNAAAHRLGLSLAVRTLVATSLFVDALFGIAPFAVVRAGVASAGPLLAMASSAQAADLSAPEIMKKNFMASKVHAFTGDVTMTLSNERGDQRVRRVRIWSKLKGNGVDSKVLIRFTLPPDIKGTGFLQIQNVSGDDDIWIFIPALGRTRRLVSSDKSDSFFGTDFANGDILSYPPEQFRHQRLPDEAIDGRPCYVIDSIPINPRIRDEVGYSRKQSWIDKTSFLEWKIEYFDTDNKLLKTQSISNPRLAEPGTQRWVAMQREMVNNQTRHKTIYRFDRFQTEPSLRDGLFSVRELERE